MPGNPRSLVAWLDGMEQEAESFKDGTALADAEINARFLRGDQGASMGLPSPYSSANGQYKFVMNVVNQQLKRHVALLTDSRPQIDVVPRRKGRRGTAAIYKQTTAGIWDATNFEQLSARELVRAGTVGATVCVPIWDEIPSQIRFLMYDPRQFKMDPSVTHAVDLQRQAEFCMVREVVPLNAIRERYPMRGGLVQPNVKWSRYGSDRNSRATGTRGIATAMQRPWRRRDDDSVESLMPRGELRHSWFRDWPRNERDEPLWNQPRHIRYVVDTGDVVLKDERLVYTHGEMPAHLFDWDIEFEHPYGIPMLSGLRRMQYTLNRIIGQVMDNVIMTNRVKMIADTNAVDAKTWSALTENVNGIFIRKRQGHTLQYELPANVVPSYVISVIELLLRGMDLVTGIGEGATQKGKGGNMSGVAMDALQIQAQSVVRLIARAYESWLERIFQQVLPLIHQYYTTDRLMHLIGPGPELLEFEFNRQTFLSGDGPVGAEGKPTVGAPYTGAERENLWQDFEFKVMPGSSLATTRIQRGVMALNLYQAGLIPGVDVLKAAEWANADEVFVKAQQEHAAGMGPGQRASRKMMRLPVNTKRQPVGV